MLLSATLIRRLLKRLCQVLAALATSSAQRLRILVSCFRRFVAKVHVLTSHDTDSKSTGDPCCTVFTGTSSARCSQSTLPLPLYTTPPSAASPVVPTPTSAMPVPPTPQHANPPQTSSPPAAGNAISPISPATALYFIPSAVNYASRYENRPHVDASRVSSGIPAFMRTFPNQSCPWLNGDWESCIHPEGALYLYNGRKRAFTEGHIDESSFRLMDRCVDELYDRGRTITPNFDANDIELVVQVVPAHTDYCQYYFVDHTTRTLFWLHDQDHNEATYNIFDDFRGVCDPSHIRFALESQYWTHCERYPKHELDRVKLLKELREVVVHASAEIITSDASLSPFGADELSRILELVNHLQENAQETNFPHSICVIAKLMHYFSKSKYFNFCGLPSARLDADKSVYSEITSFDPLIGSLSLALDAMLFWAPQAHLNDLRRVWVDKCINSPRWKDYNTKLMAEWTGITIYSTVMLAVDVSFLAVPNVNISSSQSIGIIATYLSIISITGSLVVSVLLVRQNQRYGCESADKAGEFLLSMTSTFFGDKALATVNSLPYAMLMWGMIYFSIALLYNVFKSTTVAMLASVVSGCVVVTMFILWFIWAARELHVFRRLAELVLSARSRFLARLGVYFP
ncbi:hypothetical protein DEU56DRAFT_563875 [Suillus clintonianus]|uniref:uncharacterized protein n=1 Tax=Suillus clintonianus TaxID=1904413 RepID=UPI001B879A22|nr:uncharacterized protein DEU56DRAFT_563875 [Suillus clintonianus]KAG2125742.1 hypothetical protein DEU56DRAFT_563875 [Suillus clintonianus]